MHNRSFFSKELQKTEKEFMTDTTSIKSPLNKIFGGENKISEFLNSVWFIWITAIVTLLFWTLKLDFVGVGVLCAMSGLVFILCKDATPAMTPIIFLFFVFSNTSLSLSGGELYYMLLILLPVGGAIYNVIRFKLTGFKLQGFSFAVIICMIPWLLQGIGMTGRDPFKAFLCAGIAILFVAVYFVLSVTMRRDGKTLPDYMAHILLALGILIVIQIFIVNFRAGDYKFENQLVNLGWGTRNPVATILGLCYPLSFYFATKKSRLSFLFLFLGYGEFLVILLLQSRGMALFSTLALPFLMVYSVVRAKHKIPNLIINVAVLAFLVTGYFTKMEFIHSLYARFIESGFDMSGRDELHAAGMQEFFSNPIFGVGFDRTSEYLYEIYYPNPSGPIYYHSTVVQIVGSLGLVGLFAYLYLYYWRYRVVLTNLNNVKFALFVAMMIFELYGFIDTVYFQPMGYFLMLCITLCAEKALLYSQTKPNLYLLIDKVRAKR